VFIFYQQFSCYNLDSIWINPFFSAAEAYFCLMDEEIFISICIPAFNRKDFLSRLLDSIHVQTFRNFEVVITDDSYGPEISDLVKIHPVNEKIQYFKNVTTLGTPENWNEGLRKAKGDWIKIMHDDDWFTNSESLDQFVQYINKTNQRFYFSSYTNVYPDGKTIFISQSPYHIRQLKQNVETLFASNRIGPPSVVIFKKDSSLYFDNRMKWLVDVDFYLSYLKLFPDFLYIDKPLISIGISESQVTQTSFGNPSIEIPERKLLFGKMSTGSLRNPVIYDAWWRFIRNFKITRMEELESASLKNYLPKTIQSIIFFQNLFPSGMLKIGPFSKTLMFLHFIYTRFRYP
jgi:glycosyltransferase involved in cell wall biosynthesis